MRLPSCGGQAGEAGAIPRECGCQAGEAGANAVYLWFLEVVVFSLQQSEIEERNIEYNLLSINIAINALVWGGTWPPMAWSVAFETSVMPFDVQRSSCTHCTVHNKSKHSNFKRWRQDKKI